MLPTPPSIPFVKRLFKTGERAVSFMAFIKNEIPLWSKKFIYSPPLKTRKNVKNAMAKKSGSPTTGRSITLSILSVKDVFLLVFRDNFVISAILLYITFSSILISAIKPYSLFLRFFIAERSSSGVVATISPVAFFNASIFISIPRFFPFSSIVRYIIGHFPQCFKERARKSPRSKRKASITATVNEGIVFSADTVTFSSSVKGVSEYEPGKS